MPVIIRKSRNGLGVFAGKNLKKSDVIIMGRFKVINVRDLLTSKYKSEDNWSRYLQVGRKSYMRPGKGVEFLNHSCSPNGGFVIEGTKASLIAITDIKKGNEITFDYSTTMDEDDWELNCNCGSPNCRHVIRDFKYLSKNLQKKYINLGIVPKYAIISAGTVRYKRK